MAAAPPPVGGDPGRRAAIRPWRIGRPLLMGSDEGTTPGLEVAWPEVDRVLGSTHCITLR